MSPVDEELLSAYLDGALTERERTALEARLASEPALRSALDDLRRTVSILKAAPELAPPRNFTLDPARYGRRRPVTSPFGLSAGLLRWGAALASLLIVVGAALILNTASRAPASSANQLGGANTTSVAVIPSPLFLTATRGLTVDEAAAPTSQPAATALRQTLVEPTSAPTITALPTQTVTRPLSPQAAAQNGQPAPLLVQPTATTTATLTQKQPAPQFAATAQALLPVPSAAPSATGYAAKSAATPASVTGTAPIAAGASTASDANNGPLSAPTISPYVVILLALRVLILLLVGR